MPMLPWVVHLSIVILILMILVIVLPILLVLIKLVDVLILNVVLRLSEEGGVALLHAHGNMKCVRRALNVARVLHAPEVCA